MSSAGKASVRQTTYYDTMPRYEALLRASGVLLLPIKQHMQHYLSEAQDHAADNEVLDQDRSMILLAFDRSYWAWEHSLMPTDLASLFITSVSKFARYLGYRGDLQVRIDWGKLALQVAEQTHQLSAIAQLCAETLAWPLLQIGNYEQARNYCEKGIRVAERCKMPLWAGAAARTLSGIARDQGQVEGARYWANKAFRYSQQAGDEMLKRGALLDLGYAAILDRNYTGAERRFRILLRLVERDKDNERIANRSMDVALAILNQGLILESSQLYERALAIGQELGSEIIVAEALSGLSKAEQARGNVARAKELALSAKRRFDDRGIIRATRADQFAVINSQ